MSITKNPKNRIRHTLVVCLTSCLFLFGLSIAYWNYKATKEDNQKAIKRDFRRIEILIKELATLKKDEIKNKAAQIANLVKFKSALSTSDTATIEDALEEIRTLLNLDFVSVLKNKRIAYIDNNNRNVATVKELARSRFIAAKKLRNDYVLLIGVNFTEIERQRWSRITGAKITQVKGHPSQDNRAAKGEPKVSSDNNLYQGQLSLLKNTLTLSIEKDRQEYWKDFEAREKQTIVFMGILFLGCLLVSWAIGGLTISLINTSSTGELTAEDFKKYVEQIRTLKEQN